MKIDACPKCGSKNIHVGTMDSGVTYGITSWDYTCKDCDYTGMPLIFYSEKEYKQFLKGLLKEVQFRLKKDADDDSKIDLKSKILWLYSSFVSSHFRCGTPCASF